ncbi:alpha/beta hydrolase [Cellulomonas algicola]|uniref:Alpha/beta hydrolase n=1 Tax=Cellulomonas algicola TaxID=2071633 RepID=A0A401UYR0_9CELL|nr:alpha/beta hydrolase [Cellulomonas algicola]GCD19826.1 alpha/beta hydrolase [Cellulomonas algicola]
MPVTTASPRPSAAPVRPGARRRAAVVVAALSAVVVLVLGGCVPAKNQAQVPTSAATSGAPDEALAAFYDQQLEWTTCAQGECATATVPLDYADPSGATIGIALARRPATGGSAVASLLVNPGGPGVSGVDFLDQAASMISEDVLRQLDLVAFDPRGVQRSSPITCMDGTDLDKVVAFDADYSTDAGIQEAIDVFRGVGEACQERSGQTLAHVDTVSAARDLDVLRAALGDDALSYLGYSYGTQLGATYAALFPLRVGRLVLDGALDPTLTADELAEGQAQGFENALRAYVTDCLAGASCPLTGDVDQAMGQIRALLDHAVADPLPTGGDRRLTGSLAFYGIALPLYSQPSWPYLTQALDAAIHENDGSILLQLADAYFDREADGTYSTNATEAFWAIGCLDDRQSADPAEMRAQADRIEAVAPTMGSFFSYGGTICADWPVPVVGGLDDYSAKDATAPILVVGTTNDPATPYAWAEKLATTLSTATLLTYEGEGHTAYGSSNDCVADAVDAYILTGTVPPEGTRC